MEVSLPRDTWDGPGYSIVVLPGSSINYLVNVRDNPRRIFTGEHYYT